MEWSTILGFLFLIVLVIMLIVLKKIKAYLEENYFAKTIFYVLIGILLIFFLICFILQVWIFPSKVYSAVTNDVWGSMIMTYFGGTLGGVVAVLGVWIQISHKSIEQEKIVKKYLSLYLKKNKNLLKNYDYLGKLTCWYRYTNFYVKETNTNINIKYLEEYDQNFISENLKVILSFPNGEEILELNNYINDFNKSYSLFINNLKNKEYIYKSSEDELDGELLAYLKEYSQLQSLLEYNKKEYLSPYLNIFHEGLKGSNFNDLELLKETLDKLENMSKPFTKEDFLALNKLQELWLSWYEDKISLELFVSKKNLSMLSNSLFLDNTFNEKLKEIHNYLEKFQIK